MTRAQLKRKLILGVALRVIGRTASAAVPAADGSYDKSDRGARRSTHHPAHADERRRLLC